MESEFSSALLQKTLQNLKDEVKLLKEQIRLNASKEDIFVFRLEGYCNELKTAIVDFTLKIPSQSSFEYYLNKLNDRDSIEYILELLHYCWILAHPMKLYDSIYKSEDPMEMLDKALNKFGGNEKHTSGGGDYDLVTSELGTNYNSFLSNDHYSNSQKLENKMLLYGYKEYLERLYSLIKPVCERHNIIIRKEFIVNRSLVTGLNRSQIDAVFTAVSRQGYMSKDKETRSDFLALFDCTCHVPNKKIIWHDVNEKNKQPAIASLYTMFHTMGVEMNAANKETICQHFNDANNNPILPDSLKPRNSSWKLEDIEMAVREAIN